MKRPPALNTDYSPFKLADQINTAEWLKIHPYAQLQPSDPYYVDLALKLYRMLKLPYLPKPVSAKLSLYLAAYLEDQVSGLNLWKVFTSKHKQLYGTYLPFYDTTDSYEPDEVNREDIQFIIWNTWQKARCRHEYINPLNEDIIRTANHLYPIFDKEYEYAPENETLARLMDGYSEEKDADKKLDWLFGHSYLTEPSMSSYINDVTPQDRFIVPTGPLALFLHEWITLLTPDTSKWQQIKGLFFTQDHPLPEKSLKKNKETYRYFTNATGGKDIVYLNGYAELHRFLIDALKWKDDDAHTLPQMKPYRNFVLMANPQKGILLAKDICEYIADPCNRLYKKEEAQVNAFRLLTEETLCPPDLLMKCIANGWIDDAEMPESGHKELVKRNADFIARHALLYYYRGD